MGLGLPELGLVRVRVGVRARVRVQHADLLVLDHDTLAHHVAARVQATHLVRVRVRVRVGVRVRVRVGARVRVRVGARARVRVRVRVGARVGARVRVRAWARCLGLRHEIGLRLELRLRRQDVLVLRQRSPLLLRPERAETKVDR